MGVGKYGDLFWDLEPSMVYQAGTEFHVRIYVANITDEDREYMLMAITSRDSRVLSEFPITVDGASWFTVEANNVVSLPGAMTLDYTDVALTLNLYERETNEITDSVFTALTSRGTEYLPQLPQLPQLPTGAADMISPFTSLIMLVMVMMMLSSMIKGVAE